MSDAPPRLTVHVVRHGETDANLNEIVQGQLDVPLNSTGRNQARILSDSLRAVPFARAWSSDLSRASETASEVLKWHPSIELIRQTALRERLMGAWEGKSVAERRAASKADAEAGIETSGEIKARAKKWWSENVVVYAQHAVPGTHVLIAVICAPGVRVGRCANTGVSVVELNADEGHGVLLKYGDSSHLAAAQERALSGLAEGDP